MSVFNRDNEELPSVTPSLGTRILNTSLSTIGSIGKVLDTPGAFVRGLIQSVKTGESTDLEKAFKGIIDPSQRISGSELVGEDKDRFTFSGLAAEILTDPLNAISFGGLTAAGKASQRLSKLVPRVSVQKSLLEKGSSLAGGRLASTQAKIAELTPLATRSIEGEKTVKTVIDEFRAGVGSQFRSNQRSLLTLDIPFTKINVEILKAPELVSRIADVVQTASKSLADTAVANGLKEAFITKEKIPILQAIKTELAIENRALKTKTRLVGDSITRKRALLSSKDPDFDLKVIKILEENGENLNLGLPEITDSHANTLLNARLRVEELYGRTDNFTGIWSYAQELHLLRNQQLSDEIRAGVAVKEFSDFGYVARVLTNEGRELISTNKNNKEGMKLLRGYLEKLNSGTTSSFQKARTVRDLGLDVLNQNLAKKFGVSKDFKFFDTDIASIQVNRMLASNKQINRAIFAQTIVDVASKTKLDPGDVPIEKLIRTQGPLVTNVKLIVDFSGEKLASFIAKANRPFQPIEKEGIRVGPYEFANIDTQVLKEIDTFTNKKVFTNNNKNTTRVLLDNRWSDLVSKGSMDSVQQQMLRVYFSQLDEKVIKGVVDNIGNSIPPVGAMASSYKTFLHELGGSIHLSGVLGKEFEDEVDRLFIESTSFGNSLNLPGAQNTVDISKSTATNSREWFAQNFAAWLFGERTAEPTIAKFLKKSGDSFKDFRDNIMGSSFFQGNLFANDPTMKLSSLFGKVTKNNSEIINLLPMSSRKRLLTDLLEVPATRRGFMEIPFDATEGQIKKLFKENGVDVAGVEPEVAAFFQKSLEISQFNTNSSALFGKFLKTMDEVHALYRTALTQYFPAFHSRNAISGVFMNLMSGVFEPKFYYRAFQQLRSMDPEEVFRLSSLGVLDEGKNREVYDFLSQNTGGITSALKRAFVTPVEKVFGGQAGQAVARLGQTLDKKSRQIGFTIENHARLTHFLGKKEAGLSDVEAANSVLDFLFDYNDLTAFERAVPKRVMLFYTFFRKNLPLMLEQTFSNPRFMVTYARATGNTNNNIKRPDWLSNSFQLSEDEKGNQLLVNFGLPVEDLSRFDPKGDGLARVMEIMIASMVPTIKEPYQFISGRDAFLGRTREGGLTERIASALPTSRITATGERLARAATGESNTSIGGEVGRLITGVAPRTINKEELEILTDLERTRAKLRDLTRTGDARRLEIVANRKGQNNPQIRSLNSRTTKLQDRLRKLDEK